MSISSVLFDFGGTLDADGQHWLDRFYRIYEQIGLSQVTQDRIKEAFYWADRQMESDQAIQKAGFRLMMQAHVRHQFEKLGLKDPKREAQAAAAFFRPSEKILHRNRGILERLRQAGFHLGVVSNFYGNLEVLCEEAGMKPFLQIILDSMHVGLRKPDVKLFQLALEQLKRVPDQVAFVGDSFERDIIPAKSIGMNTIWMAGDRQKTPPDPSKVDRIIYSLEDLPRELLVKRGQSSP